MSSNQITATDTPKSVKLARLILLVVFLLSGGSALIYQLVWVRMFGLVFGVTVFALSTVLTAFMAGLALGSLLFGKLVDRHANPLKLFMLLQLGIGLFALCLPYSFKLLNWLYLSFHQKFPSHFYISSLIRFVFAFLFLLIPTTLMGGTLPVLSKAFIRQLNQLGSDIGRLYGANNLGAFLGCFAAGFILIQAVGTTATVFIGAIINLLNAGAVFLVQKYLAAAKPVLTPANLSPATENQSGAGERNPIKYPRYLIQLVLLGFAIEGFTTLAYEVIWTRILLGFSFDKSVYFYTTVILSFILGLSIGSFAVARWIDRKKNLLALFAGIEIGIGILAIILLSAFAEVGTYFTEIRPTYFGSWLTHLGKEYLIFFLLMLPPVILMGATFPVVSKIYTTNLKKVGASIGWLGCLDTIGSILGSFVAGFLMVPFLGVVKAVVFTAGINLLIGAMVLLWNPSLKRILKLALLTGLAVLVTVLILTVPANTYFQNWLTRQPADRLLFYEEGVSATVAVPQHLDGVKDLTINGSETAYTEYGDIRVHRLLGYLPYLFHENPRNALVIGMGMGVTAQSLIQPDLETVDCVEICPEVFQAAAQSFVEENRNVMNQPKFNPIIEDGRSHLLITTTQYDIISSNGIHARLSPNIYTTEFYRICQQRLTADGVMCQWFPSNWLSRNEFKMLFQAFLKVFPHTSLWVVNASQVMLVGTLAPFKVDFPKLSAKMQADKVQQDLQPSQLETPYALLSQYVCHENELQQYLGNVLPHTDEYSPVEFSRFVSKARNPLIVQDLINLKQSFGDILSFPGQNEAEIDSVKSRISKYFWAEKQFMLANIVNFYNDRPLEAIIALRKAALSVPDYYRYHENLAILYYKNRMFKDALSSLQRAIELAPNDARHYQHLGRIYADLGNQPAAQAAFEKAIKLQPELVLPHYYLALILKAKNQSAAAIEKLLFVTNAFPEFKAAYYHLGTLYHGEGKKELALAAFKRAHEIDPEDKDTKMWLDQLSEED